MDIARNRIDIKRSLRKKGIPFDNEWTTMQLNFLDMKAEKPERSMKDWMYANTRLLARAYRKYNRSFATPMDVNTHEERLGIPEKKRLRRSFKGPL